MPAIIVLSSSILPIMHSRYCVYSMRISDIEIAERYSRSRFSRSDAYAGFRGEKTMLQRPEPLSPRSRWRPFPRALLSPFSLYLVGLLSSFSLFLISLSLPCMLVPFLSPSGENSFAYLYVVWSRVTRYNATPGCIVNQTHQTTRQHGEGCAR